jgi:integrase
MHQQSIYSLNSKTGIGNSGRCEQVYSSGEEQCKARESNTLVQRRIETILEDGGCRGGISAASRKEFSSVSNSSCTKRQDIIQTYPRPAYNQQRDRKLYIQDGTCHQGNQYGAQRTLGSESRSVQRVLPCTDLSQQQKFIGIRIRRGDLPQQGVTFWNQHCTQNFQQTGTRTSVNIEETRSNDRLLYRRFSNVRMQEYVGDQHPEISQLNGGTWFLHESRQVPTDTMSSVDVSRSAVELCIGDSHATERENSKIQQTDDKAYSKCKVPETSDYSQLCKNDRQTSVCQQHKLVSQADIGPVAGGVEQTTDSTWMGRNDSYPTSINTCDRRSSTHITPQSRINFRTGTRTGSYHNGRQSNRLGGNSIKLSNCRTVESNRRAMAHQYEGANRSSTCTETLETSSRRKTGASSNRFDCGSSIRQTLQRNQQRINTDCRNDLEIVSGNEMSNQKSSYNSIQTQQRSRWAQQTRRAQESARLGHHPCSFSTTQRNIWSSSGRSLRQSKQYINNTIWKCNAIRSPFSNGVVYRRKQLENIQQLRMSTTGHDFTSTALSYQVPSHSSSSTSRLAPFDLVPNVAENQSETVAFGSRRSQNNAIRRTFEKLRMDFESNRSSGRWKKVLGTVNATRGVLFGYRVTPETMKRYRKIFEDFSQFCEWTQLPSFPANTDSVEQFICYEFLRGRGGSIKLVVAAIRAAHILNKLPDPTKTESTMQLLESIHKNWMKFDRQKLVREPFPVEILRTYNSIGFEAAGDSYFIFLRNRALVSLGMRLMNRPGELCSYTRKDVAPVQSGLRVHIHFSKTDQAGAGNTQFIEPSQSELCPVKLVTEYLAILDTKSNNNTDLLFYRDEACTKAMKTSDITAILRKMASVTRIQAKVSGHSLRIGGATMAALNGSTLEQIKTVGRWKSDAALGYIRSIVNSKTQISNKILGSV